MSRVDDDELQEYQLAILEGCSVEDARARGVSANNDNSRQRQLRRAGRLEEEWASTLEIRSSWTDDRTDSEREHDWQRREHARLWLDVCSDKQRQVLVLRYGLDDNEPRTLEEVRKLMGYKYHSSIQQLENSALRAIRRHADERLAHTPAQLEALYARRAYNRAKLRKHRAKVNA